MSPPQITAASAGINANRDSELWDPTRVGNLLIILNKAYTGGEIAVGSGEKEMFFDPAAATHDQFYIARWIPF